MDSETSCELCQSDGGERVWSDDFCRVIRVDDPHYPAFLRVILNRHVREMTDLLLDDQRRLMAVVLTAEDILRRQLRPDKINLASLGNVVPHLHWHVIPRWADDRHFPSPIWASPVRDGAAHPIPDPAELRAELSRLLGPSAC